MVLVMIEAYINVGPIATKILENTHKGLFGCDRSTKLLRKQKVDPTNTKMQDS